VTPPSNNRPDRRWPQRVYGQGSEPDPRFSLANERTFLAWMRTGLGFVAAGVAIAAVAQLSSRLGLEVRLAAIVLIICGLVSGVGGLLRWMTNERALRRSERLPSTLMLPLVTGGLVIVSLIAFLVIGFA
jgi:putative membrane protein